MLNDSQLDRTIKKLERLEETLSKHKFSTIGNLEVSRFETMEQYHQVPDDASLYVSTKHGDTWGGERSYCWFRGTARIPEEYSGKAVYVHPVLGGFEGFLWVNGIPKGIFTTKHSNQITSLHEYGLITNNAEPGKEYDIAIEFYAGHYIHGMHPLEENEVPDFTFTFEHISLCVKNQDIIDFIFDLRTLIQLAKSMDKFSFRRADVLNCLIEVHKTVYYSINDLPESTWRTALAKAREIMKPVLSAKNSQSAPIAGLIGHSHMDTAWLWPLEVTLKKCARTYSNQISLMEQYPEYRFIQSSAYHSEMLRRHYPKLFEMIQSKVAEGRYEPNGAVWVECDCNITSGEFMIRQMLWGQNFTRKYFNFTSNCLWMPDTFGYSAAIPQIMKGCHVDYFLTTKLSWNDTNKFPYEAFYWEGIDGTRVFTHFNSIHCWPDAETLIKSLEGRDSDNYIQNKRTVNKRLVSYGFGDGGGGPQFEMLEASRRVRDLEGCPKAEHVVVGQFMKDMEREAVNPPLHQGELYLEMHRGTLTNMHNIKRNNRKAELLIHDLELLTVKKAIAEGKAATDEHLRPLVETLLVNQFHDILPGSSIAEVHDRSCRDMFELLRKGKDMIPELVTVKAEDNVITVINTLGFERNEIIRIPDMEGMAPVDGSLSVQRYTDLQGRKMLCIGPVKLPPMGSIAIKFDKEKSQQKVEDDIFCYDGKKLTTPFAKVSFEDNGTIGSFIDTRVNRELRGNGYPLNTFLIAEDVPALWDNWDVDADIQLKFENASKLLERRVISTGPLEFRIRSRYQICEGSFITQDMIFYAHSPRVDFETIIDWNAKHRFLKTAFDTTVKSNTARHEIQFGYCQKPTTRNNTLEQAMFEVLNHKYTDLSEPRYGISVLNDCKYGVSVEGSSIRLSLHKGGCNPDPRGDIGIHECVYSFLPHIGGFKAESVVHPAYCLNVPPIVINGRDETPSLAMTDADNIIIETVKPCEDNQKAFIIRLYEAEGSFTHSTLKLGLQPQSVELTDMLEETIEKLPCNNEIQLTFRPFEIKTIKVGY